MLEISELAKSFGSRALWEGLNWTFMREGMTAVVGSSGSGKSTLFPRNIIVPFAAEPVSAAKGCYKVSTEAVKTSRLAFIVV